MIIAFSGLAGSGKDYIADIVSEKYNFQKIAFADPVKRVAKMMFDFSDEQLWGPSHKRNEPDLRYYRLPLSKEEIEQKIIDWSEEEYRHLTKYGFFDFIGLTKDEYLCYIESNGYLTPRVACQEIGTGAGRKCYKNIWIEKTMTAAQLIINSGTIKYVYTQEHGIDSYFRTESCSPGPAGVLITDCRFKNEIDAVYKSGGKVVRIVSEGGTSLVGAAAEHTSETEQSFIPDSEFNFILKNSRDEATLSRNISEMFDILGT